MTDEKKMITNEEEDSAIFDEVVNLAYQYWEKLKAAKESMDEWQEWDSPQKMAANACTVTSLVAEGMLCVETAAKVLCVAMSSKTKRQALAKLLDKAFVFPGIIEMMDETGFYYLVTFIAKYWNSFIGKVWPSILDDSPTEDKD